MTNVKLRLADLSPRFVTLTDRGLGKPASLAEAQGLFLLCPSCFARLGSAGCHGILVPFEGRGAPGLVFWHASGTSLEDLTISPSIQIYADQETPDVLPEFRGKLCRGWHGHIIKGEIVE